MMKKIYSLKERIIYILLAVVFGVLQLILLINFSNNSTIVIIAFACIVVVVLSLLKLFAIPNHIVINNNKMKVFDFPLLATNKFYIKKRSLILWNSEINIDEVETAELVELSKEKKIKYIGYTHLLNKYIKISLLNSNSDKYIYASIYSKFQIENIINLLNNNKT